MDTMSKKETALAGFLVLLVIIGIFIISVLINSGLTWLTFKLLHMVFTSVPELTLKQSLIVGLVVTLILGILKGGKSS